MRRQSPMEEIRRMLAGQQFASIEEAQAVLDRYTSRRNSTPLNDFAGLSPEQMTWLLHRPFEAIHLAEFAEAPPSAVEAPVSRLFDLLVAAIGEDGLRQTATGKLPRDVARQAALSYRGEEGFAEWNRYIFIRSETDFDELHATRLTAQAAGLIRKYKGRFTLTRRCRTLLDLHGPAGAWPVLMRAYVDKINWAYRDRMPQMMIVQQSFLFSLYLLHRYGDEWREGSFYGDAFLRAYPDAVESTPPTPWWSPEVSVRHCYRSRCLDRFLAFFGLIETRPAPRRPFDDWTHLRKSPLLDQAVRFKI